AGRRLSFFLTAHGLGGLGVGALHFLLNGFGGFALTALVVLGLLQHALGGLCFLQGALGFFRFAQHGVGVVGRRLFGGVDRLGLRGRCGGFLSGLLRRLFRQVGQFRSGFRKSFVCGHGLFRLETGAFRFFGGCLFSGQTLRFLGGA